MVCLHEKLQAGLYESNATQGLQPKQYLNSNKGMLDEDWNLRYLTNLHTAEKVQGCFGLLFI